MSIRLNLLKNLVFIVCLWAATMPALAATWQEYRDAGFRAFANTDYADSVGYLEQALTAAQEARAAPKEVGEILQKLSNAYFAAGWIRRTSESIAQWDRILARSDDEAWVSQQRSDRDRLALLVSELLGNPEPETPSAPPARTSEPEAAAGAATDGADVELEVDQPFQPDEPMDVPAPQPAKPGTEAPAASPASGKYAVHLVSLTDPDGIEGSWAQLKAAFPGVLADKGLEVRQIEIEGEGTYYRIYAAPFSDAAAAGSACEALTRLQQYCAVATLQ